MGDSEVCWYYLGCNRIEDGFGTTTTFTAIWDAWVWRYCGTPGLAIANALAVWLGTEEWSAL
jgi:hypothetical protein